MFGTVFVVNKYKVSATSDDIYIGRGSPLGNPYSHLYSKVGAIKVDTREEAIACYKEWLREKIFKQDTKVINAINAIINKVEKGNVNLTCFCAPKPCHGEVIADMVRHLMLRSNR